MTSTTTTGPRRLTEADILGAVQSVGTLATDDGPVTPLLPQHERRIAAAVLTLADAAGIHDAVPDVDTDVVPDRTGITFALCTCDNQLHDPADVEAWKPTLDEAKASAVFYPEGTVHYLRRLVSVTPMRGA